ncbi:hypothetical protein KEM52_002853 [Ascosphaera acerosa]|nr:hypothetical protein KEM52_002853 [Ascosphaera acerosa]
MAARRSILLTLDALDTLYHPRAPIARQYLQVARAHGLPIPPDATESRLQAEFYKAFKAEDAKHPIYGYDGALRGTHLGPREWWGEVIQACLQELMGGQKASGPEATQGPGVPKACVEEIIDRFGSIEAYALYDDVGPFFDELRTLRETLRTPLQSPSQRQQSGPRICAAVVSNSDGRLDNILRAFGLRVGDARRRLAEQHIPQRSDAVEDARADDDAIGIDERTTDNDIDFVLTSFQVGHEKPHPRIFELAADMAASPGNMKDCRDDWFLIHVGDHYRKDGEGAVAAGYDKSLVLQRDGHSDASLASGDSRVERIASLLDVLPYLKKALQGG